MTAFQAAGESASLSTRTKFTGYGVTWLTRLRRKQEHLGSNPSIPNALVPELVYGTVREAVFCGFESLQAHQAPVVQLDKTLRYERRNCRFESYQGYQASKRTDALADYRQVKVDQLHLKIGRKIWARSLKFYG